jgi:DNA-directed RNA polymerase subunit omega
MVASATRQSGDFPCVATWGGLLSFMARITVEDCLGRVSSRFELVMLASIRAKQLIKGAKPCVVANNREVVVALREIAAQKVRWAVSKP